MEAWAEANEGLDCLDDAAIHGLDDDRPGDGVILFPPLPLI
jgi:hypothetical protein